MKSRGPFLPRPFNLSRGTERGTHKFSRRIDLCRATDNDAVNNEPKRGSGSRAESFRVHRNRDRQSDAETEPSGEEF
jgi:hypothetical protein